ncbi:hypothetical protein HW452_06010 [Halomonas aquamarina]|uniref:Uncharacterized protein n=1 Tax=Vreelandella aquamarina TaxID=77097 RepID=A0ACC5VT65_9GAMM|nr:hypothetical protein [Halomonas aquamarina]MBZ5487078.1 hypothetical protein [Halomonas aquamarina]
MSEISYLPDWRSENFHDQGFLLLSASGHDELFEQLVKALHALVNDKTHPIVIYQCLPKKRLELVYHSPLKNITKTDHQLLSVCSVQELIDTSLAYRTLKDKHQVLAYVGYSPAAKAESARDVEALMEIATHQWRLLDARRMADQQACLKAIHSLIIHDIQRLESISQIMERYAERWLATCQASGMCLFYQSDVHRLGTCPSKDELRALLPLLKDESVKPDISEEVIYYQDTLAVQLSGTGQDDGWLLLFRARTLMNQMADGMEPQRLSHWLACETDMALTLARSLSTAIIKLENTHENPPFIGTRYSFNDAS